MFRPVPFFPHAGNESARAEYADRVARQSVAAKLFRRTYPAIPPHLWALANLYPISDEQRARQTLAQWVQTEIHLGELERILKARERVECAAIVAIGFIASAALVAAAVWQVHRHLPQ